MAQRVERDHPVSPPRQVAGQRRLHLLREQQPRGQHGHPRPLAVDGVGEPLTVVAEVRHDGEDSRGPGWPASQEAAIAREPVPSELQPKTEEERSHGQSPTFARRADGRDHRRCPRNRPRHRRGADRPGRARRDRRHRRSRWRSRRRRSSASGTIGLPLDVTDRESFAAFLDQVEERLGPLDVLINNAGIMPIGPFVEETDATAKRMIDINLARRDLRLQARARALPPRRRGHLVQIASAAGKAGFPDRRHLLRHQARGRRPERVDPAELAGTDVDVSVVMPVVVNTELGSGLPQTRGFKTRRARGRRRRDRRGAPDRALRGLRAEVG